MIEVLAQAAGDTIAHGAWLTALAVIFGLFMAWSIGANDVANAMGTSVGSKALTLKQAIIIAGVVEGRSFRSCSRTHCWFRAIPDQAVHEG